MALNWDEIQGRTARTEQNNNTYKSTIDWDRIQGRTNNINSKRIDTTKTPAYNLLKNNTSTSAVNALQTLNSATKAQSYNNVSQKSAVTTNNTSLPTQMSVTSATIQKTPVFKTLEEAQNYAKENNIKISNDNIEKMKQILNTKKLTNQIPKENIIELNEEDKDFYLSRNRLNIYKNEYELAENSLKRAEEKYNKSSGEEKEQALQELNKEKEEYQEKLKKYTTAVKYDEYFNPVGRHLRNIAGSVSQGVANIGNYLNRTLDNNKNSAIGNTYDNIDAEALYKYLQNPNDVSLRMKGFNSLVILNGKARTSEHAKKLFEDLTSGNFKGDAKDLEAYIENLKVQDYEDNKIMKNTYNYVQTNDEIVSDMNLSGAEKTLYDAEKVIGNMLPTIGATAINPTLGRTAIFANANESGFNEALKEGATYNQAKNYGNLTGGIELGTEMLFDSTVGKQLGLGGLSSSEPYANYVGDTVTKTFGKTAGKVAKGATNLAGDLVGEGTEEVISEFANPLAKMATYNPNAPIATPEDLDNAFISSMLPTAILGGGTQAINSTYNALTDTTKNELPKSSNNQFQQQNNKVIPQQIENSNNANVGQNSLSNISKVENNSQYSLDKPSVLRQSVNTAYEQGFEIPENTITTLENIQNKRQGLNIEFDTSVKGNGMYTVNNDGTRTIKINPNSSRAIEFTVVHELGHDLKAGDSKSYNELRNFVLEYAKTKEGYKTAIRALGETYSKELGEGKFVLNDEATNDILGEAIGNQEFLNSLAQKQPNLFQRIYNWFKNVLFDGNNTGRTLEERRFLNSLQSKFITAYNQSFNNTENSQTNYSIGGQVGMKNAIGNDIRFTRLENNLNRAQTMAIQGIDNEYIRQQTNWFQDKNGDWKFEFSDKDMSLKNSIVLEENKTYKLSDILEHDLLFTIYPELADYKVQIQDMGKIKGSFDRNSEKIKINSNLKKKIDIESTLIHEIQHAIQKKEGFKRGRSSKGSKLAYYNSLGEIEADNTKNRYLEEKYENLNRDLVPPESSKTNPKHSKMDNYLNKRTVSDKIKDGIYKYLKDRGVISDSINEELDSDNKGQNSNLVVGRRGYIEESRDRGDVYEENFQEDTEKNIYTDRKNVYVGRRIEGLEDSSSFSLGKNTQDIGNEGINDLPKIPKGYTRLYRGLSQEYDANYDRNKIDNSNRYESWTDNYELAKAYGDNVYYIDIPTSKIKDSIIDENDKSETYGDRNLIYRNNKSVGIKGKSGNEYMLYTDHDDFGNIQYNEISQSNNLPKTDNQGRELTKEQQERFKKSEARDEEGRLLEVYHGTNEDFTVFDLSYLGTANDLGFLGDGFYFATHEGEAKYYGSKVMKGYLDIRNPYNIQDLYTYKGKYISGEYSNPYLEIYNLTKLNKEWENIEIGRSTFREISETVEHFLENVDIKKSGIVEDSFGNDRGMMWNISIDGETQQKESILNYTKESMLADALYEYMWNNVGYISGSDVIQYITEEKRFNNNIKSLREVLQEKGYDGIVQGTFQTTDEIVAFNSNQFKSIDNLNPTYAPDIRYSQSNNEWQNYLDENFDLNPNSTKTKAIKINKAEEQIDNAIGNKVIKNENKDIKPGATVTTRKYEVSKINNFMNKVLSNMETSRFGNTKELRNITKGITRDIRADSLTEEKLNQYANVIYDAANRIDTQYYEENKDLKNNIRNTRLYVSPEVRSGIADWQDFRKSNFGILSISDEKSSLSVDTFYSELSKERADLFPKNIVNEIDQLERISEVAKSIRKIEQKASEYLENNYGKEVRDATIEEIKKNINELSSDIKQVQKVEADNLKKTTEKEELRLLGNDLTVAEIKELHKQNEVLKRDYEKAYRKELLTEKDKKQLDRLVKGEITLDEISGTSNREAIKRLYEYKKPLEDNNNKILQAKKAKKAVRFETAEEAVKNSGTWKDKKVLGGLRYGTETAERNIYDVIPDKEEAKKIVNTYFKPVHIHEAQATRKKNEIIEKVKKLNIDTKEKYQITESIRSKINEQLPPGEVYKENMLSESALVQLLGEKVINTKDIQELGADVSKIDNATNVFREIYNELFELSNDALIANGYNSVEYRKDYFPHFTEEKPDSTIKKIASKLGIETSNQELATDLAGLTHTFKPGKKWVGNFLERKGKATDYNALKGLDTYLEPVMDVIYHTDDIQNLRALEDSIRYKYSSKGVQEQIDSIRDRIDLEDSEKNGLLKDLYDTDITDFSHFVTWLRGYTDNLSGKKSIEDRNMEHMLGRAAYNTMKNVEGRVASNMIGGNINSALTNFIPIVQGWGEISSGSMTKAMWDTARNAAKNDGLTDTSDFLVNRKGNDRLYKTTTDKISEKAGVLMTTIDEFTSETLVRAKYYDNIKSGMNEVEAMSNANEFAAQIMGDRSKGARPTSFNAKNPIAKMFTMFQLEVNNQYRYWLKDLPRNVKDEVGNSLAKALFKIFLGSWIYGELKEKITGSRSVTDPVDIVADTFKDVLSEDVGTGQTIMNLGNRIIDELPFISTITGGGRIPISSAFPDAGNTINALTGMMTGEMDTGKATGTLMKELSKPAYYFLLPTAGGQVKKAIEGISAVANGGEYGIDTEGNKKLKFPIDTSNMNTLEKIGTYAKAATFGKYSLPTAKDYVDSGYKQLSAKKTQGYEEAIKKGISADTYLEVEKQIRNVKPDGEKFVNNERRTKIINIIEKQDLTKEQKEYLYKVFYKNEI